MSNWLDRVVIEEKELTEKIEKLEAFLNGDVSKLSACALTLLKVQKACMKSYQEVLHARIGLGKADEPV